MIAPLRFLPCFLVPCLLGAQQPAAPSALSPDPEVPQASAADVVLSSPVPLPAAFTPPATRRELPAITVVAQASRILPQRALTARRGEPSSLPDLPLPPVPPPLTAGQLAALEASRTAQAPVELLQMGATIYDHRLSHATWTHPRTGRRYEAVCGFDLGLLAGVGEFRYAGRLHHLLLMHTEVESAALRRVSPEWTLPAFPEVAEGEWVLLEGDGGDAEGMAPLVKLRAVLEAGRPGLEEAAAARREVRGEAEAWRRAHPPQPQSEVFQFRPHRGSRYLDDR